MDLGTWHATVYGVREFNTTEQLLFCYKFTMEKHKSSVMVSIASQQITTHLMAFDV